MKHCLENCKEMTLIRARASQLISSAQKASEFWIEPDAFLRYLPVIKHLHALKPFPKILEVGSGDFGLSTYLRYQLVKVDLAFSHPPQPRRPNVSADASKLPFPNGVFDLVFSVDLLEHIPPNKRETVVSEMLRVSRKEVLAIFPAGAKSNKQDLVIAEEFQKRTRRELGILKTHQLFPFSEEKDVTTWLRKMRGQIKKWKISNSFNLALRKILITGWLKRSSWAINSARAAFQYPFLAEILNFGNCYRRILQIEKKRF